MAVWFMYYNFCRVHSTLRATPAMEAGLADHVWTIGEMCALLSAAPSATNRIGQRASLESSWGVEARKTRGGIILNHGCAGGT
jgi:hypothetical protein